MASTVLLYSDDPRVRDRMRLAIGPRPARDLEVEFVECDSFEQTVRLIDEYDVDLLVLDGEASPAGGMGIARQLKDEIFQCPPVLVITGRPQDAWLATWSRAEGAVSHPIDPVRMAEVTADLLRQRLATLPATTA